MTINFDELFERAFLAANEATNQYLNDNPGQWYPCGFAWAKFSPARGKIVSWMKSKNIGGTDSYAGGYQLNPVSNSTQAMFAKEAGVDAFIKVMSEAGFKFTKKTYVD